MVERFRQSLKTNRGWYGMMLAAAYSPETINDALTEVEVVQGVTPARLQELARQYLVPDKAMRISVVPSATAKRSEEHTSELQSLMRISYAVFCLKTQNTQPTHQPPLMLASQQTVTTDN